MYISNMYKYEKDDIIYVAGELPEGAILIETMNILNAREGYDLVRISDDENVGANIWLRNGDVEENYREEKHDDKWYTITAISY